jgi:hypothetical protein
LIFKQLFTFLNCIVTIVAVIFNALTVYAITIVVFTFNFTVVGITQVFFIAFTVIFCVVHFYPICLLLLLALSVSHLPIFSSRDGAVMLFV